MVSAILSTLGILLLAFAAKYLTQDWLHPASVFCLLWVFLCGMPILLASEDITSGSGPLWILLNAALVVAGGVAGSACAATGFRQRYRRSLGAAVSSRMLSERNLRRITAICAISGVVYILLLLHTEGVSITQLTSMQGLGQTASKMSLERYTNTKPSGGIVVRIVTSALYLAPLFGGTLFVHKQRRSDTVLSLLTMLPCILSFAVQSTRAAVLFGAAMWLAGYITARNASSLRIQHIHTRSILHKAGNAIAAVLLLVVLISGGQLLRGELRFSSGEESNAVLSDLTKTYLCGHLGGLSAWMDYTNLLDVKPSLGTYTFAGIYDLMEPGSRAIGMYSDYVMLPTGETNVYTYFRALIEDVTLYGALFVMLTVGFWGGFSYRKVLEGKEAWHGPLAAYYAWILFGITSLYNYNSILLALILFGMWHFMPELRGRKCA
jgi:oligosaccharide repeat unit polymerase